METKKAINVVLKTVLDSYKYTSLAELNALLRLYNVTADRGTEDSRMYHNNGLMYRVLDERGNKVGSPIKASQFFMKPTLKKLETNFKKNESLKNMHRSRVKNTIDMALLRNPGMSLPDLIKTLEKAGIATLLRQSDKGLIYGITYIDHQNKCVFNGSDLGKPYSAKMIQERCGRTNDKTQQQQFGPDEHTKGSSLQKINIAGVNPLTDALLQEEHTGDNLPFDLKRKRRKKKRNIGNN